MYSLTSQSSGRDVKRGSFCVDFTNTPERSQVGYWIVKKIEKSSYLVPSVWERVYFSPSWYSASVKGRCLFCLHTGWRSQTALAFDLFLLAVHSTCPQTVSALAHNVSGIRLGTRLGSVYFVRLPHYRFLWLTSSTFVLIVMDISHIKSLITWCVPSSSDII